VLRLKPSEQSPVFLTFDGEVLEVFWGDKSNRVHVSQLKDAQINTDRRGNYTLVIKTVVGQIPYHPVDEQNYAKATEMVAEIQKVMATFRF